MITAQWGTPEYNQQQQAMWNKQAAEARQQQDAANQQLRQRQAEQQARATADKKHWDTMSGISGANAPLNGNYGAFQHGRNIAGRDHNGKLASYTSAQSNSNPSTVGTSSGGGGVAVLFVLCIFVGLFIATLS